MCSYGIGVLKVINCTVWQRCQNEKSTAINYVSGLRHISHSKTARFTHHEDQA